MQFLQELSLLTEGDALEESKSVEVLCSLGAKACLLSFIGAPYACLLFFKNHVLVTVYHSPSFWNPGVGVQCRQLKEEDTFLPGCKDKLL